MFLQRCYRWAGTRPHKFKGAKGLKPRKRQRLRRHFSAGKVRDLLAEKAAYLTFCQRLT